jgi:oligo-alginate lyase
MAFQLKNKHFCYRVGIATAMLLLPHVTVVANTARDTTLTEHWNSPVLHGPHGKGWSEWLLNKERQIRQWIANSHDNLTAPVGWMHDYIDPDGKSTLAWKPYSPQPNKSDTKNLAAWVAFNRAHNIRQLMEAGRLYKATNDKFYLNWVSDQLSKYALAYPSMPLQDWGGRARLMTQTLDEAVVLIDILEAYRLTEDGLSAQVKRLVYDSLVMPIIDNLIRSPINGNIAIWQATAIYVASRTFEDKSDLQRHADGPNNLLRRLREGVNTDGFWSESSLGYQAYVLQALRPALMIAMLRPDKNSTELTMHAKRLMASGLSLRITPDRIPNPSDTIGLPAFVQREFHLGMFPALRTPEGLAAARSRKTWATWSFPPDQLAENLDSDISTKGRIFTASKFALLKSGGWSAFFKYGDPTGQHAHNDRLSVELYFNETGIMVDPGTVNYGNPLHEGYFKKSIAHNVVTINGQEAAEWGKPVKVSMNSEGNTIVSEDAGYMAGQGIQRTISLGNQFLMSTSVKSRDTASGMTAINSFECTDITAIGSVQSPATAATLQAPTHLKHRQSWAASTHHQFTMMCDQVALSMTLESDIPSALAMFEAPRNPYSGKTRYTFLQTVAGSSAMFRLHINKTASN